MLFILHVIYIYIYNVTIRTTRLFCKYSIVALKDKGKKVKTFAILLSIINFTFLFTYNYYYYY